MKRTLIALAAILLAAVTSAAHNPDRSPSPYKYSVRLYGAYSPLFQTTCYEDENPKYIAPSHMFNSGKEPLEYIYSDWSDDIRKTPVIGGDFSWTPKYWLTLKGNLGFTYLSHDNYSSLTGDVVAQCKSAVLTIMPEVQLNYVNSEWVRMYFGIGVGCSAYVGFGSKPLRIDAQCDMLGMEIGKKVFGFFEFGFGSLYTGAKLGAGYRF